MTTALLFFAVLLSILFAFWRLVFLRNPRRTIPTGNFLLAPADGTIVACQQFEASNISLNKNDNRLRGRIVTLTSDIAERGYIVAIFMSVLNVHYNRAPMSGRVVSVVHSKGTLMPVNTLKAGLTNEKTEIVIENKKAKIKVIQIAGFVARRIETYVKPGDTVERGQIIGRINLGSQVMLVLPESLKPTLELKQKVTAGETSIAN